MENERKKAEQAQNFLTVIAVTLAICGVIFLGIGLMALSQRTPITFFGFTIGYEHPYENRGIIVTILGIVTMLIGGIIGGIRIKPSPEVLG